MVLDTVHDNGGRVKKLIAVAYQQFPETVLMQVFRCETCNTRMKRLRGCVKPFKQKAVWIIDECYFCGGKNKKCTFCGGKGKIPVQRCPRTVNENRHLLPYFYAYRNSHNLAWPDGRGRLYQPKKLVDAFDIWSFYFNKLEEDKANKAVENAKKNSRRTSSVK